MTHKKDNLLAEQSRAEQSRAEQSRAEQSRAEQSRAAWLDSIKGILIFAVVLGHTIGGDASKNHDIYGFTHYLIYCVHMPIFMYISGYFGKRQLKLVEILKKYLLPYLVFDIAYAIYSIVRGIGDINSLKIYTPTYVYWYILCLAFMRLLASSKIRDNYILVVTVLLTFITPLWIDKENWLILSWGRVALLWFMFYAGRKTTQEQLERLRGNRFICSSVLVFCVATELLLLKFNVVDISWATHDYPLSLKESMMKYIFMLIAIGCFCGFTALVPRKPIFLSRWGKNSIVVYLLHPYAVDVLNIVLKKLNAGYSIGLYFILFLIVAIITDLLSRDLIKNAYDKMLDMICKVLRLA